MTDNKKIARLAGIWYLAFILLGGFSMLFVDDRLIIAGDAAATLENCRANMALFIFGVITYFAGYVCFLFVANALGKLFKATDGRLTLFMKITVYAGVAVALSCKAAQIIGVTTSSEALQTFYETGAAAAALFWGLWLLPLGLLILKSNYIPQIIGILLLGACVANLADFTIHFFIPNAPGAALNVCYTVGVLGELGLVLWLLIKGVKTETREGTK